jgi:hypothetical protein
MDKVTEWSRQFDMYKQTEQACLADIAAIGEIKHNLKRLIGTQEEDDFMFYKVIIDNSQYYLKNSLKIRITKFIKDLNHIHHKINGIESMEVLDKPSFTAVLKDYETIYREVCDSRTAATSLTWVKSNDIKTLDGINATIDKTMRYHLSLIQQLACLTKQEKQFYCGDGDRI